jgi:hypothetical protein
MGWFKIDNTMPEHPKVLAAGPTAAWLHVCALAYCDRNLTDGHVPDAKLTRLASVRNAKAHAKRLVEVGLWSVSEGGFQIHDYLTHQRSKAETEGQRAATRERVKRHRNAVTQANVTPSVTPLRREESSSLQVKNVPDPEHVRLSELLADLIAENGSKRPTPSSVLGWQREVRLMVERDGRTLEGIEAAIRWCQADEFWHGNVMSMGKLRKQYDKLRIAAKRETAPAKSKFERHGKAFIHSTEERTCHDCPSVLTNYQANNQSGLCDEHYEKRFEGAA